MCYQGRPYALNYLFFYNFRFWGNDMKNAGKKFEQLWKQSAEKQDLFILRLNDSDMSFNPNKELRSRFTLKSPADFIMFYNGHLFMLEMKSTHSKSISFQREPDDGGMIKLHQISSLSNTGLHEDVESRFVINFRHEEDGEPYSEDTYFWPIEAFNDYFVSNDRKSAKPIDIVQHGGIIVKQEQRRKLYDYDVKKMLEDIIKEKGCD